LRGLTSNGWEVKGRGKVKKTKKGGRGEREKEERGEVASFDQCNADTLIMFSGCIIRATVVFFSFLSFSA